MRIYTRIVLDMTQDDLPVVESESYEYDGPMALCGWGGVGGSEGMGHETEGDGSSQGGGSDSGGDGSGEGGFGGLGIGNPKSYGARENPRGYEASVDRDAAKGDEASWGFDGSIGLNGPAPSTRSTASIEKELSDRELANKVGWGLSAVGLAVPGLGLAGSLARQAAKNGRSHNDLSSMEKAADANGMGEGERGRSSDSDKYTNLPQGLVDYLNQNLAPKDDSYKSIADIINAARDKAGLNNTTTTTPAKPVATDYSDILNKYSDGNGLGVSSVVGSGSTQAKPYNNSKPNFQIDGSGSATGVTSAINSAPVYKPAPAAKAIDGGNMNGGTSLISGRRTLA